MVHSAEWSETMRRRYGRGSRRYGAERLLRSCGYGEPSLARALWSASDALTLIAEAEIQPFRYETRSDAKLNEMHVHEIPWPVEALRNLGGTEIELRVTLSYFIEPNPARRGWIRRHRYASHGLRFDVQTPTESLDEFRGRINRLVREEDEEIALTESDSADWVLGPALRSKGSLHSDIWRGTDADLARESTSRCIRSVDGGKRGRNSAVPIARFATHCSSPSRGRRRRSICTRRSRTRLASPWRWRRNAALSQAAQERGLGATQLRVFVRTGGLMVPE
jgi:hypothetical protein